MEILTGFIMLFTGVGAFFTFRMWMERNEANIEVRLDSHPVHSSCINICVENHGPGNARNLKFKIVPSTTGDLFDMRIESLGFIKYGIRCLNSGTRRESMLTSIIGKFEAQKKYPIVIEVTYHNLTRNSIRKSRRKKFILDFREFDLISPVPDSTKYLQDIAQTLKNTENNIRRFVKGLDIPHVTVRSSVDANIKNMIWPLISLNAIDKIPVDVQREKIQEILNIISHNPWYDFYSELGKLPPEIQRKILYDFRIKLAEWENSSIKRKNR